MQLSLPAEDPSEISADLVTYLPFGAFNAVRLIWPYVRTHYRIGAINDLFVVRITPECSITHAISCILWNLTNCSHIQISFAILASLLEEDGGITWKGFYGSRNVSLPVTFLTSFAQFGHIIDQFNSDCFVEEILEILPSTKYIFHSFLSICVFLTKTESLLL